MVTQIVKIKTSLSEDEVMAVAKERASQFREVPGLIQKYYVRLDQPNQYGGIYIWDSRDSLMSFRETELCASIPEAYEAVEPPQVEVFELLFRLRD